MKLNPRHLQIFIGIAVVLAIAVWLWPGNAQPSHKDIQTMQTYIHPMTTHCVGRFLIDVPAKVSDVGRDSDLRIAGIEPVQRTSEPEAEVLNRLDKVLLGRAASQHSWTNNYGKPMPDAKVYHLHPNVRSIRYSRPSSSSYDPMMDGYIARPGGLFRLQTNANDESEVKEFNDFLIELEPALSVRENAIIPTTPGFCIDGGFLAMNPKRQERTTLGWGIEGHPEVRFAVTTRSNDDKVDPGHLDKEDATLVYMGNLMNSIKTLRKRRFELAGMAAQEWSVEITETPEYEFRIEIPGAPNDKAKPFITLSMRVGSATRNVKPSLSTGEALALWDAVIQTLRLRPGAV